MNRGEWQDLFNWAWDVWPNHLGQPLDVDSVSSERLTEALALTAELYEAERDKGNDHENAKHRVFEAIMRIAGKLPPPLPAPTPGVVSLPLLTKGRVFVTSAGPFDYREIGAFTLYDQWLLHGPEVMAYYPVQALTYGATVLRVMLHLGGSDYWRSRRYDGREVVYQDMDHPAYVQRLPEFVDWLASQGLYTRICLFGGIDGKWPIPDRRDHWSGPANAPRRQWVEARTIASVRVLKSSPTKLYEITNEFNQIGWGTNYFAIHDLVRRVRALDPACQVTGSNENGPNADTPSFVGAPNTYTDSHLDRRRGYGGFEWVKRSSETPVVDDNPNPFISGEPINFGSAAPGRPEGHDNERSPAVALAYAGTSRMKGYYTNFHCEAVLDCERLDQATAACAAAWKQGLDLIPHNPSASWRNGHWTESPFIADGTLPTKSSNEDTWKGIIRIFGRSDGYWVSVGHRRGFNPHTWPGRSVTERIRIEHGDYECRIWKE